MRRARSLRKRCGKMVLLNFRLGADAISLEWGNQHFDIHNCYDFRTLHFDVLQNELALEWRVSEEAWAASETLSGFLLCFKDVSYLAVKARDAACPIMDDSCLSSFSFHAIEQRDEFESITLGIPFATDDLTFFFESEWGLKVNARSGEFIPSARKE